MFSTTPSFSGYSVNNIEKARAFYAETLGLAVTVNMGGALLDVAFSDGHHILLYHKPNHQPADFTVLNFVVPDIDAAVDGLKDWGIETIRYDALEQDERGIVRGQAKNEGPDIAWFTDPAGNIIAVLQNAE